MKVGSWLVNGCWDIPTNVQVACPNLLPLISHSVTPWSETEDSIVWAAANDGILAVKRAYDFILKPQPKDVCQSFSWNNNVPPSHSMPVWRYFHNKMPTDDTMLIRGFLFPSMCSVCKATQESTHHVFFECLFSKNMWLWMSNKL